MKKFPKTDEKNTDMRKKKQTGKEIFLKRYV